MEYDHNGMVHRDVAVEHMLNARQATLTQQPTETVALGEGIDRRVLVDEITAARDVPALDHATMDGYAVNAHDEYPLNIVDSDVFPEDEPPTLAAGQAIRIATGAPLPEHANAVLKQEVATVTDGQLRGPALDCGTFTYERASNVTADETLFEAGERLSATDTILLRDLAVESVLVRKPFSVGLLATGTEIHDGRIVDHDSPMLAELVQSWGHSVIYEGTVPDEYDRIEARIAALAAAYDVVMTTGGTSAGPKDYVVRALDALGDVLFHRARIRPGKPIALAELPDATVIAVPGKPVGALTSLILVARPFFIGTTTLPVVHATLTHRVGIGSGGFEYAIPVTLTDGTATPLGHVASPLKVYEETFDPSVLSASTRATCADGFIITKQPLNAGETVDVIPSNVVE
jgi:molybdopterin molybdotransferase